MTEAAASRPVRDCLMRPLLGDAIELVLDRPGWWALGAAGFLARGGLLLYLAPLIELPSPVTVTLMFGIDSVSGAGQPSERLVTTVALLVLSALAASLAMVVVAAWTDAALFRRVSGEPREEAGDSGAEPDGTGAEPDGTDADGRVRATGRGVVGLCWLQPLGLLPGLVAFGLAAPAIRDAAIGEFLLPSAPGVPFLVRVLERAQAPLLGALIVLVAGEAVVTVMTRGYLAGWGSGSTIGSYRAALGWIARRPVAAVTAWVLGWTVLLGTVAVGLWTVSLAWAQARAILLDSSVDLSFLSASPLASVPALGAVFAVSLLFVAVWVAAVVIVGVASTLRSTMWTLLVAPRSPGVASVRWPADAHA